MRQEIGANDGIKITEKEEMIMWGTATMGNPINLAYAKDGTVPENHTDVGLGPIPEDHIDAETISILGSHVDEVILIPKNRVDEETVHIRTGMLTEVRTLPRIKGLTTLLWMP